MQDRKLAFLNAAVDRRTVSPDRVAAPASPYVLQAGAVIPAALITGIRSDLPGQITAQVTENVYDSPTGRILLIPQGTRLIGQYDSQRRLRAAPRAAGLEPADPARTAARSCWSASRAPMREGYAGLEDGVDYHWWDLAKAAGALDAARRRRRARHRATTTAISSRRIRDGAPGHHQRAGQQIVRRQLNVQPTLTIRPGFPVRVIVNRDLVLDALRQEAKSMAKLKLGAIADDKPVKLTVELPAAVHRDLVAYAEVLGRETGRPSPNRPSSSRRCSRGSWRRTEHLQRREEVSTSENRTDDRS